VGVSDGPHHSSDTVRIGPSPLAVSAKSGADYVHVAESPGSDAFTVILTALAPNPTVLSTG